MFRNLGKPTTVKRGNRHSTQQKRIFPADLGPGMVSRSKPVQSVQTTPKPVHLKLDSPLLLCLITLVVLGLIILYSASYDYSQRWASNPYYIIQRQVLWVILGIGVMIFLAYFDYHRLRYIAFLALVGTIFALVLVLILDEVTNNAVRSLWSGSIRPSELAKLVVVIYVSVWLFSKRERLTNLFLGLYPLSVVLGIIGGLIVLQPDYSAVVTILFLGAGVFFLAGGDLRQLGLMLLGSFAIGLLVVKFSTTASTRFSDYVNGWKNPLDVSDHVMAALQAVINGGWLGQGLGNGVAKILFLPVAPTDSIFAVAVEEFGVLGALVLLGLFVFLLWRSLGIARRAPDMLGAMLVGGLSLWIAFEAFVNMAVILNILPFAGNALPFISSGGSSLVASLAAMGIILNVARQSVQKESEMDLRAFINMRGRDRRRSVPSSDNVASPEK